jgi:hypothetical protein
MIIVAFTGFIAGTLLGMRFRVAILFPATLVTVAAIVFFAMLSGLEGPGATASLITALTSLQVGYLLAALKAVWSARKLYPVGGLTVHDSR